MVHTRSEVRNNVSMNTRSMTNGKTRFRELSQTIKKAKQKPKRKIEFVKKQTKIVSPTSILMPIRLHLEDEERSINIDFDDAHNEWMANKKRLGNGTYAYYCGHKLKNGKTCKNFCIDKLGLTGGCAKHYEGNSPLWFE